MKRISLLIACVVMLDVTAAAQAPVFEVASVKRNVSGIAKSLGGPQRGHFLKSGTLRQLVQAAYRRGGYEIRTVSGGLRWMDSDRFDIDATVDPGISLSALYLPDGKGSAGLTYVMLRAVPGQAPPCSTQTAKRRVAATDMTMAQLADVLSPSVERDVHDQTGLTGVFTLKLEWTDDLSIFTAIREQLGLKLEPARGPVDVIVVDRAEPPTPD